jgi:RNA polymerase sigma-70 factor (ECF subfamily)
MNSSWQQIRRVTLAQAGDRDALGDLLDALQPRLHGYLSRLIGDATLADDVFQDVCVAVCRTIRDLRDPALFAPWTYRIGHRLAVRALQRKRLWEPIVDERESTAVPPDMQLDAEEMRVMLRDDVDRLPPASREIIALHYWAELTIEDAAAVLDVSPGTAKSRLAYALGKLRQTRSTRT